jgi:DnaJ-class molecular chaperone
MGPLEILGLTPGSTIENATNRWRQLVRQYHPDHNPNESQKFLEVQEAYSAIKANPTLLDGIQSSTVNVLRVSTQVTIKDFYLAKELPIRISRQIFCKHCSGTGSETKENGLCDHCGGSGQIKSNVLKMLNRSATCPVCSGVGVPKENMCTCCAGSKYETDNSLRKVRLTLKDYHKKTIALRNAGHQTSRDTFGNVFVFLDIVPDDRVLIEDLYFRIAYKVLPVQKIIGDVAVLSIFGRELLFKIEKNSTETMIEDRVLPGVVQRIRIMFEETPPVLTDETIKMYKEILSIEKQTSL